MIFHRFSLEEAGSSLLTPSCLAFPHGISGQAVPLRKAATHYGALPPLLGAWLGHSWDPPGLDLSAGPSGERGLL